MITEPNVGSICSHLLRRQLLPIMPSHRDHRNYICKKPVTQKLTFSLFTSLCHISLTLGLFRSYMQSPILLTPPLPPYHYCSDFVLQAKWLISIKVAHFTNYSAFSLEIEMNILWFYDELLNKSFVFHSLIYFILKILRFQFPKQFYQFLYYHLKQLFIHCNISLFNLFSCVQIKDMFPILMRNFVSGFLHAILISLVILFTFSVLLFFTHIFEKKFLSAQFSFLPSYLLIFEVNAPLGRTSCV